MINQQTIEKAIELTHNEAMAYLVGIFSVGVITGVLMFGPYLGAYGVEINNQIKE